MRRRRWADLELRRVLVNLKSGRAIGGLARSVAGDVVVLVDAELYEAGASPTKLDGEVIIDLDNIDFAQALAAPKAPGPGD